MKERPILFSGPMVRAILDGRKTQTRRIVKPDGLGDLLEEHPSGSGVFREHQFGAEECIINEDVCPYGKPGDLLWVKETFDVASESGGEISYGFRADHPAGVPHIGRWRPSIHMPRRASRITLKIIAVRLERLGAISEADALAEGCAIDKGHVYAVAGQEHFGHRTAVGCYQTLWATINGAGSWDQNPWVWVIDFKRVSK